MRYAALGLAGLLLASVGLPAPVYSAGGEYLPDEEQASTLEIAFRLYAGGIPFGDVTLSTRIQGEEYLATSTIETSGLINRWWESKIEAASNGAIGDEHVKPARYDNFTTRRGRRREFVMSFREDGPDSIYQNPSEEWDEEELRPDAVEARHSMDPVSAMVYLMNSDEANARQPCDVTAPVYDGQRRYDVAFRHLETTNVNMDNGLYSGPAMTCEIAYVQVAGELQNIVENGGEMPTVYGWIAEFESPGDSEHVYLVPIRLWSNTEFGMITAVATELRIDGRPVGHQT